MDADFRNDALGKQLARASKRGARFALILGEEELALDVVAIKDMVTGTQRSVPTSQIAMLLAGNIESRLKS